MHIILASQSPRRKQLLEQMGLTDFDIVPAHNEERTDSSLPPAELAKQLALCKAQEVAHRSAPDAVVIGADTIVVLDNKVLGKPANTAEAFRMLTLLSARKHRVFTGVAVVQGDKVYTAAEETAVSFCALTEREILHYIDTGEPMDKAGAYGIQGKGALFIDRIEGDFYNVMGLPICRLGKLLMRFGINPF